MRFWFAFLPKVILKSRLTWSRYLLLFSEVKGYPFPEILLDCVSLLIGVFDHVLTV